MKWVLLVRCEEAAMDEIRDVSCRYRCHGCRHEWSARFEEHVHITRGGEEHDLFLHDGMPCPNPEVGTRCPACGDLRVHLLSESVKAG
jgi:hypothetical protein